MKRINTVDKNYFEAIDLVLNKGFDHTDRTGVGTTRYFGHMFKFEDPDEFPIITCKKAAFKNTVAELLWFLSGSTNVNDLASIRKPVEKWWRPFAINEEGDLGPMYGRQLRNFNGQGVDQVKKVIYQLTEEKNSRRILMTSYNPVEAELGALYPCHGLLTQFCIDNEDQLHMSTIQRSADIGLGLPHNWISYSVLQRMIALVCDLKPGPMTYYVNDLHIYSNHLVPLTEMNRKSYSESLCLVDSKKDIDSFNMSNFQLVNYKSGPRIDLEMAI